MSRFSMEFIGGVGDLNKDLEVRNGNLKVQYDFDSFLLFCGTGAICILWH